jgi:GMP synthase (glutamine-hydrolysing)
MQLQAVFAGGAIGPSRTGEHGYLPIRVHDRSDLLRGLPFEAVVFHDHDDEVVALPDGFRVLASSAECAVQAIADPARRWWGTQFHPEEFRPTDPAGEQILRTFFALAA